MVKKSSSTFSVVSLDGNQSTRARIPGNVSELSLASLCQQQGIDHAGGEAGESTAPASTYDENEDSSDYGDSENIQSSKRPRTNMRKPAVSPHSTPPNGTILSSWTVMSKTMIGSGMLALASAVSECGWFLGLGLFFAAGLCSMFTLHLLNCISSTIKTRAVSFYVVADKVAPKAKWIVDGAITIKCLGVGVSYLQVAGQTGVKIVRQWSDPSIDDDYIRYITITVVMVLLAPVCFRKRLSRTAIVNAMGLFGLLYVSILAVVYSDVNSGKPTNIAPQGIISVIASLPIFIFTFTCHQNMFLVSEDMKDRTRKRLDCVAISSELTALLVFLPALVFPYLTYGNDVSTNYTLDLDNDQIPVQIGLLLLGVAEACAFPLQLYPCRKSLLVLLTKGKAISEQRERLLRRILTVIILLVSALMAFTIKDLGVTFKFVGIVGSNTICFIMPTYLYLQVFKQGHRGFKYRATQVGCVLSCLLVPTCLGCLIYQISQGEIGKGGH